MPDPDLPTVFTRAEALAAGLTRHQVERRVATGAWHQLRRGVYCRDVEMAGSDAAARHLLQVRAVLATRADDALVSHLSAACVLGWPRPLTGWGPVSLTAAPGQESRRRDGLVVQAATIRQVDRWTRSGHPVTSAARTLADVLRHVPTPEAVAIADHALRCREVTYEQVAEVLRWQAEWPYATRAARALLMLDPRRETWLESWSVVHLHLQGLPLPDAQVDVRDDRGRFVGRLDVLWDSGTAGESDGRLKYDLAGALGALADPEATADELLSRAQRRFDEQKRRQDRLAELGLQVVRWTTADVLHDLAGLVKRIERHRVVAARSPFTGQLHRRTAPPWLADRWTGT
ncbi:MAG TPA: type IV toxin-antitoxin system AbiEi family antitoxin domain-containing protein [Actinomycetales bacterium]|jgi:hypothetical protein